MNSKYSKINSSHSGFAHVFAVLAVGVLVAIAGTAYFVYRNSPHNVTLLGTLASSKSCTSESANGSKCQKYTLTTTSNETYKLNVPSSVSAYASSRSNSLVTVTGTNSQATPKNITVKSIQPSQPGNSGSSSSTKSSPTKGILSKGNNVSSAELLSVVNSGSTNRAGWTLVINDDGSGTIRSGDSIRPNSPAVRSQDFAKGSFNYSDLKADLANTTLKSSYSCMRSASFGTVDTLKYSGHQVTGIDCYMINTKTKLASDLEDAISKATE